MRLPGFIGPSYTMRSVNYDCQRCINMYPELNEIGSGKSKEIAALVGTPGLRLLATIGAGPIRGMHRSSDGKFFVVSGTTIYSVTSAWIATSRGTLNSSTGVVSMADNGTSLVVVDGDDGYVITLSSYAFAQITDPDFLGADTVTYQDGYFIFNKPNSGQFYISDLNSTDFNALDIASSEGAPDNVVAVLSDHRDLWVFNEKTIEVFFNSGNADFPFERIQGSFVEQGCAAKFSIAKMNNTVFWLGQDNNGSGIVYMAQGYQPQRISTHAVEFAIQGYEDISDAVAFTYQQDGHFFYVLNFPSASTTWVFDTSTNLWHERVYTNGGNFERHRANNHSFVFDTHVVGDYATGKIYKLDSDYYSDNGDAITRQRVAPHISENLVRIFYSHFQLDMETGTGLDGTGQGTDPQAMMDYSDDGGHTFSNEKWVPFGKIGQRQRRAIWRRLGSSRDRVYRITITDPVKVILIGADIGVMAGAA